MIKTELYGYILQHLNSGYQDAIVKEVLSGAGFSNRDIDDTFNSVYHEQPHLTKQKTFGGMGIRPGQKGSIPPPPFAEKKDDLPALDPESGLRYATASKRLIAQWIDAFILGVPIALVFYFLDVATSPSLPIYIASVSASVALFFILLEGLIGETPGKVIMKIQIVNRAHKPIGILASIIRFLGKVGGILLLGLGWAMVLWDGKKQALHDKMSGSFVVVREKQPKPAKQVQPA